MRHGKRMKKQQLPRWLVDIPLGTCFESCVLRIRASASAPSVGSGPLQNQSGGAPIFQKWAHFLARARPKNMPGKWPQICARNPGTPENKR